MYRLNHEIIANQEQRGARVLEITHRTGSFRVNTEGDPYGDDFWKAIQARKYEPDTVGFLEDNLSSGDLFMDIGAANGAMTIIASLLGSNVIAYEPDPTMFKILKENLELNPDLKKKVTLKNCGVSNLSSTLEFSAKADSSILSSIVVGDKKSDGELVSIEALSDEIELIRMNKDRRLFIKMDIEGAEWRILNDQRSLVSLKENHAIVLLAVHPGFYRPHKKLLKGIDRIALTLWHLRNYKESLDTFRNIVKYGKVFRTNLNSVRSAHFFAILILGGYHEFVLDFQPHEL